MWSVTYALLAAGLVARSEKLSVVVRHDGATPASLVEAPGVEAHPVLGPLEHLLRGAPLNDLAGERAEQGAPSSVACAAELRQGGPLGGLTAVVASAAKAIGYVPKIADGAPEASRSQAQVQVYNAALEPQPMHIGVGKLAHAEEALAEIAARLPKGEVMQTFVVHENLQYEKKIPGYFNGYEVKTEATDNEGGLNYMSSWIRYESAPGVESVLAVHMARGTAGTAETLADFGLYETIVKQQFGWLRRFVYGIAKPVGMWAAGVGNSPSSEANKEFDRNRLLARAQILANVDSMARAIQLLEKKELEQGRHTTHFFAGHSLGGAIAGLMAVQLKHLDPSARAAAVGVNSPGIKKVVERFMPHVEWTATAAVGHVNMVDQHDLIWTLDESLEASGGQVCMAIHEPYTFGCEEIHEWKDATSLKCLGKWNYGKCLRYFSECFFPSHNDIYSRFDWPTDTRWQERQRCGGPGGVGSGAYANQTMRPGRHEGRALGTVEALRGYTGEGFLDPEKLAAAGGMAGLAQADQAWRDEHKAELKQKIADLKADKDLDEDDRTDELEGAEWQYHEDKREAYGDRRVALKDERYQDRWFCAGGVATGSR